MSAAHVGNTPFLFCYIALPGFAGQSLQQHSILECFYITFLVKKKYIVNIRPRGGGALAGLQHSILECFYITFLVKKKYIVNIRPRGGGALAGPLLSIQRVLFSQIVQHGPCGCGGEGLW